MVLSSISTFQKMNHLKNEPLKPDPNLYLYSDTGEIGIISNRKRRVSSSRWKMKSDALIMAYSNALECTDKPLEIIRLRFQLSAMSSRQGSTATYIHRLFHVLDNVESWSATGQQPAEYTRNIACRTRSTLVFVCFDA